MSNLAILSQLVGRGRETLRSGGVREMARGGLAGVAASLANRVIAVGSAMLLARMLGTDGYGLYVTATATMLILAVLTEFGMQVLLVREVSAAHAREAWGELMGFGISAARFTLLVSAALGVVACGLIWFTPLLTSWVERVTMTLMLMMVPISTLYRFGCAMLYGLRRIAWAQIAEQFLLPALSFGFFLAIYLAVGDQVVPPEAWIAQIAAGFLALGLVGYLVYRALAPARAIGARAVRSSGFPARAFPFLVMGAAGTITLQLDTVIVSASLGHSDTGIYRVASQAAVLTMFGIQIMQSICSPYFSRLYQQGNLGDLRRLYNWATVLAIASAAPVLLIFVFFGGPLIALTFGEEFTAAQPLMIILSAGYLLTVACGPAGSLLAMTGEERWASRAFVITAGLGVLLALVLVRFYGATGVALGTIFGSAGCQIVMRIHARRTLGF